MSMKEITVTGISLTMDPNCDIQLLFYKLETEDGAWAYETAMIDENSDSSWVPATESRTNKLWEIVHEAYPCDQAETFSHMLYKIAYGASREIYLSEKDYERIFS